MGLGLLGRGVGDARYLASCGADLIVTDLKSEDALASSHKELEHFPNIRFVFGKHQLEDFSRRDMILKAAGVPNDSPYLVKAREEGTPVRMSADLFAQYAKVPLVGVTGTRGKSTVTHMIYEILKSAGRKPVLGGNVRGVSTLALLESIKGDEIAVLELDSWQCQGFGEARISPNIAVFTNLMPDHMNYYHGSMEAYLDDKAQIFLNQKKGDTFIAGAQVAALLEETCGGRMPNGPIVPEQLPEEWKLTVLGAHNRENASLARAVAGTLGIPDTLVRETLESFSALAGRLEFVREVRGVRIYNDTNSTTPEAARAALEALDEGTHSTILIMGGADKGLDMTRLIKDIPKRTKKTILLEGTGTARIRALIPEAPVFGSLKEAFEEAMRDTAAGDTVVLSPAFASFGMFKNEYDRGDQFIALAHAYV